MKTPIFLLSFLISIGVNAQQAYWQQDLRFTIRAELNDADKTITASETIIYKNNSPTSLDFILFHIWPNAYKNETTALIQQVKNDASLSKKMENFGTGHIEGLAFTINGQPAKTEPHPNPQYIDVIKLLLNNPLSSLSFK